MMNGTVYVWYWCVYVWLLSLICACSDLKIVGGCVHMWNESRSIHKILAGECIQSISMVKLCFSRKCVHISGVPCNRLFICSMESVSSIHKTQINEMADMLCVYVWLIFGHFFFLQWITPLVHRFRRIHQTASNQMPIDIIRLI